MAHGGWGLHASFLVLSTLLLDASGSRKCREEYGKILYENIMKTGKILRMKMLNSFRDMVKGWF